MVSEKHPPVASSVSLGRRVVSGIAGAGVGVLLCSMAVALGLKRSQGLPWFEVTGLLSGLGLPLFLVIGVWVAALHPGSRLPKLRGLFDSKQRRWRAALSGPAIVLAWLLMGQLSLRLLSAFPERPAAGGVLTAASALGLLTAGAFGVDRLSSLLAPKVGAPGLGLSLLLGLGFPLALVPASIVLGTTSGVGSVFALFGTFRRPELDLSPVVQFGLIAGCGYAGAYFARRLLAYQNGALLVLAASCSLLGLHKASALPFREAVKLERAGGLGALSVRVFRGMSDADGDGFSSRFGGGDCNDRSDRVFPGAVDVPGNGIDEDCRGGDRKQPTTLEKKDIAPPIAARAPDSANVLLLTIDTLRWDLGFSGAKARERLSPQLDAFAARSTVFERAYSLASYTSKSLGPLLIGKYPSETRRTFEHFDRFSPEVPFLQERIREAGIQTTSVQGYWYFFFKGYGFERGWDQLDTSAAPKVVSVEADRTSNGAAVAERTIEHLSALAKSGERFFLWSHWIDPHAEYVPHPEFGFGADSRARYDGEVAFVDQQLGRVLMALQSHALDQKTIVIITSDHGEAFGEHGMIRHGFEVWEELVRVPLLVHVPGAKPQRISARRSLIDIAPTVLDALALPKDPGQSFQGRSLLPEVLAPPGLTPEVRPVLVDMPEGPHNRERRAFYDRDFKLITSAGQVLGLYNLTEDPGEKKDLSSDVALVTQIRSKMDGFLDQLVQTPPTR